MDRGEGEDDQAVYLLARYVSKSVCEAFEKGSEKMFGAVEGLCESHRRTTWVESGIGFIGR